MHLVGVDPCNPRSRHKIDMDTAAVNSPPEASVPDGHHGPPWGALVIVGLAFGLIEAVFVADLRFFVDPSGERFPLVRLPAALLALERAREVATLLLLGGAAAIVHACTAARFATFLFLFGLWDVAYYVALRVMIGWPQSLGDWDLLFLLPVPWLGPVYAPLVMALIMVAVGVLTWHSEMRRGCFRVQGRHVAGAVLGATLCIWTFVGDVEARALRALPERYRLEGLAVGIALGVVTYLDAWRMNRRPHHRRAHH